MSGLELGLLESGSLAGMPTERPDVPWLVACKGRGTVVRIEAMEVRSVTDRRLGWVVLTYPIAAVRP